MCYNVELVDNLRFMEFLKKKELYLFLGFFLATVIFVAMTVFVWFSIIEHYIMDVLNYHNGSELPHILASAIILFPVVFFVGKMVHKKENLRSYDLRNAFLYFALLILSIVTFFSLSSVIGGYLSGDLTLQFFLKMLFLSSFMFMTAVVIYYEVKGTRVDIVKLAFGIVLFVSLVGIVWGLIIVDPSEKRDERLDDQKVSDIINISRQVENYYREFDRVPASLDDLSNYHSRIVINDPKTDEVYEYLPEKSGESANICANFITEFTYPPYKADYSHGVGRECFFIDPTSK